jgi:uncharacterized protein (TIGR02145 family)
MKPIARILSAQLLLPFYFLLFTSGIVSAQTIPQKFSYQSIIRNPGGQALANQPVALKISLLQGSETGAVVYSETHTGTTNGSGLMTLQVGGGSAVSGSISSIDWSAGPYFIKTETDPEGGTNYSISGSSQLLSVPYALYSGNGFPAGTAPGQMMYWNGSSWIAVNPGTNGQTLTFCNGVPIWGLCPDGLPQLTTSVPTAGSYIVNSGGNISSDGGSNIIARGVCWSTSENPTIALSTKTSDGTGLGTYRSIIEGLNLNTTYYVRAYASNLTGTSYGNQISFQTSPLGTVSDIDGNTYSTLIIGSQVWMKENLKVSKYRNGNPIPSNLDNPTWQNTTSGAYAIYNNDPANNTTYGKLFNWYAVADPRGLCPVGWHVPSDAEWTSMEDFLGGAAVAGGKMKSTGTIQDGSGLWQDPNTDATNSSGFLGLPGGSRFSFDGGDSFDNLGNYGFWWAGASSLSSFSDGRTINFSSAYSSRDYFEKNTGFSVRCLRD